MIYRTYRGIVHSYKEGCHIARDDMCVGMTQIISVRVVSENFRRKPCNIEMSLER
jgi:hypothetical protein